MAGMGPAPKAADQRRRRNATVPMVELPAVGREGPAPRWPLLPDVAMSARRDEAQRKLDELELALCEPELKGRAKATAQRKADAARQDVAVLAAQIQAQERVEAELWTELWALPQAVEWERLRWHREVAQYVRWKARAEQADLDAAREARQLGDRLGLTPLAMLRLRWEVVEEPSAVKKPARAGRSSAARRDRLLKVVDGPAEA